MYRYAIIGFGGLGKKHLCNLKKLEEVRGDIQLAAICGTTREDASRSVSTNIGVSDTSNIDFSSVNFYQDYKEMIDKENLDFVLSVLPSYLHREVAVYALSKGLHLFSEKPMALTLEDCDEMLKVSHEKNVVLQIGQVLRFSPAWRKIKGYVTNKEFGCVRKVSLERYSQMPMWTWKNWILDPKMSGGCLLDMHVHDVDIMNWMFGMPKSLRSITNSSKVGLESVTTQYFYDGFVVEGRADWSLPQSFPFTARCRIDFDTATILFEGSTLTIYKDEGSESITFAETDDFYDELNTFLSRAIDGVPADVNSSADSVRDSVAIVAKEKLSAETMKEISL